MDGSAELDRSALKALSQRSDARGVGQFLLHLAALGLGWLAVYQAQGTPWLLPAVLATALVLTFLFAPLHETVHRTAFRSRALNDLVAIFCGFLLLLPASYFRAFHLEHHRWTQDPARDPELARPKPASLGSYLLHLSGLPYWRERIETLLRHARGQVTESFIASGARAMIALEARLHLAGYLAVALYALLVDWRLPLLYWILPVLLGQPLLRAYLLAEHWGCPLTPDMLKNSRTTHSNALVRALAWNMPYHAEHHAYPALPFHALPKAHAQLTPMIAVQAPGYLAVHREAVARIRGRDPAA